MKQITNNQDTITKFKKNIKLWWEAHEHELFLIAVVFLLSVFLLGAIRLILLRRAIERVADIFIEENAFPVPPPSAAAKNFMASINGEKYYPAGCKAANNINKENIIWFTSEKEAREMGYTPSARC